MRPVWLGLLVVLLACGRSSPDWDGPIPAGFRAVCGESSIIGAPLPPIRDEANRACGISDPVRLFAVAGVQITGDRVVNCKTARALDRWVAREAAPAIERRLGSPLTRMEAVGSYSCRTRNHRAGAKLSEHAKGNAIDLGAFRTADGQRITVLKDWGKGDGGRALRDMWRGACGPFGVVLGPNADRFHQDHFHFDISNMRRPYCR